MTKKGFALVSVSLLIGLILAFGLVLVSYIVSSGAVSRYHENILTATQLAEAGIRKAIFCLNATSGAKCSGTYGLTFAGESDIAFGGGAFTTVISGSGTNRTIAATGRTSRGQTEEITVEATTIPQDDDSSFGYALQSGDGGAHLENNAEINGTLYANGDVDCQSTQAAVTGDIYVAKTGGEITSCTTEYHAHADRIIDCEVGGDAFYRNHPADISGTDVDGTKYAGSTTPAPEDLPDVNLQFWRDSAEAGGMIVGDYAPADNSALGPVKITGNLLLSQNVDVTVNGPIWVMGNMETENNSSLSLASGWGVYSTAILADDPDDNVNHGKITIVNGTFISGSGNPKSHILLVSTNTSMNDAAPAMSVANNASGAVFLAINGVMRLQNRAGAKAMAAKRLFIDQLAEINYVESDLADMKFSNSPGGVWRVVESTWREVQ